MRCSNKCTKSCHLSAMQNNTIITHKKQSFLKVMDYIKTILSRIVTWKMSVSVCSLWQWEALPQNHKTCTGCEQSPFSSSLPHLCKMSYENVYSGRQRDVNQRLRLLTQAAFASFILKCRNIHHLDFAFNIFKITSIRCSFWFLLWQHSVRDTD